MALRNGCHFLSFYEETHMATKYYSRNIEGFQTSVRVNGRKVPIKFEKHIFSTEDADVIAALDKELARPESGLAPIMSKINMQAAELIVQRHQQRAAATKGGAHSLSQSNLLGKSEMQQALQHLNSQPEGSGLTLFTGEENDLPLESVDIDLNNPANLKDVPAQVAPKADVVAVDPAAPKPTGLKLSMGTPKLV